MRSETNKALPAFCYLLKFYRLLIHFTLAMTSPLQLCRKCVEIQQKYSGCRPSRSTYSLVSVNLRKDIWAMFADIISKQGLYIVQPLMPFALLLLTHLFIYIYVLID